MSDETIIMLGIDEVRPYENNPRINGEQTGRKCRMMELDPHYCDVISSRLEQFTGQKAELIAE